MDTDRNLLFGVLALQADLIDCHQFVETCALWTTRKHVPLADLLVERGWIVPADRAHVDYLLQRKLQKHAGDPRASLAAVNDDVKRSLAALQDADIQRSLAGLPRPDASNLAATVDQASESGERYTLNRLHATGGIGRVWLARDHDLGRDVALKELRPERAEDAALGARFLQEARITGQLEHPGIVPVYEVAQRPGNRTPFYTMRFVRGRTLSEAVRAYHQKRTSGDTDALQLPVLLNAFVMVCNTVAYAHSRGVIHRDLKGQNVILGDFGEVVVLDWGLAKVVGRHEGETPGPILLDDAGTDSDHTVQGQTLGTPAYMAPEQAAGRPDLIDHRTDVYGLGAILYEILTGRPPFAGPDTAAVLQQVQEEEPAPPCKLWPDVPPALEALCLRALAKRPADRPAAAADLALAVQGWQEQERRKAEEALRESEALYHSLVESLPCSVFRKDLDGRFTFANHGFCELVGRPLDQLLCKTDFDINASRDLAEKYRRDDRRVIETAGVFEDIEEHLSMEAKGKRYVHTLKTAVRDASGKVTGMQGICWDVTARRLAEEELRKSRERFELAVAGSQDGLWDWDLTTGEVYYSPRYKAMLGYEDHEFPNRIEEWSNRLHPDDVDRVRAALRAEAEGRESLSWLEFRMRHKDGSYRWIRSRAFILRDAAGRIYRKAGSHEDITDRKDAEEALRQSQERYRSVIAAMQDGILLLDADGGIRECNRAAERILGLSADQLMGRSPHDPRWRAVREDGAPVPGDTNPAMVTLRTGRPCTDKVMGVHKPDGTLTWITVNAQPLFQADGRTLAGVAASFEEITDRKRTEEQLRRTVAELAACKQQLQESATSRARDS